MLSGRLAFDRWRSLWQPALTLLVFAAALWLIHTLLAQYHFHEVRDRLRSIPTSRLLAAIGLATLNYVILIGYDWLALRSLGRQLPLRQVAFIGFTSFVASFNFGALFGGTALRARLYSQAGLSTVEIAELIVKVGIAFWLGVFIVAGFALLVDPDAAVAAVGSPLVVQSGGGILLAMVALWLTLAQFRRTPLVWRGWQFQMPHFGIALAQLAVAAIDLTIAAGCLYVLLPADVEIGFLHFAGLYCVAVVAALLTHVPGGIGVFEAAMIALAQIDGAHLLAALLAFRVIYYLFPLGIAGLMFAGSELALYRTTLRSTWTQTSSVIGSLAPSLLAGYSAVCGAILLFSGSTPSLHHRLDWLAERIPLGMVELAHFSNSLIGLALLIVSSGLQRRLDSSWWLACILLLAGSIGSLLKGADYEEAAFLFVGFCSLLPCRPRFYRRGALLHQPLTASWFTVIALVSLATLWIGYFSYRHTHYSTELWWTFALHDDAPRFLRASVGLAAALFAFGTWRLLTPQQPEPEAATPDELRAAEAIVATQSETWPALLLLGDKRLLLNDSHTACLGYALQGRTWVVMGDPIGPREELAELVWSFRTLCDRHAGRPVFYQVHPENLTIYLDQGFSLHKLGEEARVSLKDFTLEGAGRKSLRQTVHRMEREQCEFSILPAADVPAVLPELHRISDAWLSDKHASEKGFSLGYFDEQFLQRFPVAIVRQGGVIIAFANVLATADRQELSPDLMRYTSAAPSGVMEYLFLEMMRWGQREGYAWFNLGMAPLSGMEDRHLAPLWNKAAALIYRHGQHFYSFDGLRKYKEKFDPEWSPRYLASYGGLELPRILADVTALIGRKRPQARIASTTADSTPAQTQ